MDEYRIDIVGKFNNTEIRGIVDRHGKYWFTQEVVADALEIDRTTITRIRSNHPGEFSDDDFGTILFEGRRRVVFSEEGFLTVCDMSTSEHAYRLRKWMRQQFRVRQQDGDIVVQAKRLPQDDLSDLDPDLAIIQCMLNELAENRRRVRVLEADQRVILEAQAEISSHVEAMEGRIAAWEDGAKLKPGEMTAIQLAHHCGWISKNGGPHNVAVILAAVNAGFAERKLIEARREQGPDGRAVEVHVFTPGGVSAFLTEIDTAYEVGKPFEIVPNETAQRYGLKNRRFVMKKAVVAAPVSMSPARQLPRRAAG